MLNQLRHRHYAAPELLARRPNELWGWDITKLLGPTKWTYFHMYVILDVFSRYVVGWGTRGLTATRGGVLDHASRGHLVSAHPSDLRRPGCLEALA